MEKPAPSEYPLHPLLKRRWSPVVFRDQPLSAEHLGSLFEAARWSASSFNEQPWCFVSAARHSEPAEFAALLSLLKPQNSEWAAMAPMLMFSVAKLHFDKTGKPNLHAWHDVGQAAAHLSIEAVDLGVFVHQMAGFDRDKARQVMRIPETHEAVAAIALGYGAEDARVPDKFQARENEPRVRKPAGLFVYKGHF